MPKVDPEANSQKRRVDEFASKLLSSFAQNDLRRQAEGIIKAIRKAGAPQVRIVLLGAAGSNKTSLAHELSTLLSLPAFDVDEYIEAGDNLSPDYEKRLRAGWYNLWPEVPAKGGWIIEHVEAGHPDFVEMVKPKFAVLLSPGIDHLKLVAAARSLANGDKSDKREIRSFQTAIRSAEHFRKLDGTVISQGRGWTLKELK